MSIQSIKVMENGDVWITYMDNGVFRLNGWINNLGRSE